MVRHRLHPIIDAFARKCTDTLFHRSPFIEVDNNKYRRNLCRMRTGTGCRTFSDGESPRGHMCSGGKGCVVVFRWQSACATSLRAGSSRCSRCVWATDGRSISLPKWGMASSPSRASPEAPHSSSRSNCSVSYDPYGAKDM